MDHADYYLFLAFIKTYTPGGFKDIDAQAALPRKLEDMTEKSGQFFFIADMVEMKILFASKRCTQMMGIEPAEVSPYHFFEATHPEDLQRHSLGRSKLFKAAQDLFIAEKGEALLSTNLRIRDPNGNYTNLLFQCYIFFSPVPYKTVFLLQIHTNIDGFKKNQNGYHYFLGKDMTYFRYPDKELLQSGNIFTAREFEIIKMVQAGLDSEAIGRKLFRSKHTINAHRKNILKKSGKTTISDVIYDLHEQGWL